MKNATRRSCFVVLFSLMIVLNTVFASDPARAFLPANTWAIDWDIGMQMPPGWPPVPSYGGPGLRYSPSDTTSIGLQVHMTPFFMNSFDADLQFAWKFLSLDSIKSSLATSVILCNSVYNDIYRLKPGLGLTYGVGTDEIQAYLGTSVALWFPAAEVSPWVLVDGRLGIIFPSLQNLSLEFVLSEMGQYSSVTRSYLGQPSIAIGMLNPF